MAAAISEIARAKVNLALHVLGRRLDGYHELDSLIAFADFGDELHFEESTRWELAASGPFATGLPAPEHNIVLAACRAAAAIAEELNSPLPPMRISLEKNLPVAAGLGGGSADAAATLRGLLAIAGIDPSHPRIAVSAFALGADVPVCIRQLACRMRGAGESILPISLGPFAAVLVNPGIAVRTAAVFEGLGLAKGARHGASIVNFTDAADWRNDLMPPAIAVAPAIAEVIAALQDQKGLRVARMSGSGASCFGIFQSIEIAWLAARNLSALHPQWWVQPATLG